MILERVVSLLLEEDPPMKDIMGDVLDFHLEATEGDNFWKVYRKASWGWQDVGYITLNPTVNRYLPFTINLPGKGRGHRVHGVSKPTRREAARELWRLYQVECGRDVRESALEPDPGDLIPYRSLRGFSYHDAITFMSEYRTVPGAVMVYSNDKDGHTKTFLGVIRHISVVQGWIPVAIKLPGEEFVKLHPGKPVSKGHAAEELLRAYEQAIKS